jgi:hypothetical protein
MTSCRESAATVSKHYETKLKYISLVNREAAIGCHTRRRTVRVFKDLVKIYFYKPQNKLISELQETLTLDMCLIEKFKTLRFLRLVQCFNK